MALFDILQFMMDNRGKESETELINDDMVAFILFFVSFESSSTLMCFATLEIAMNQDMQRWLQNGNDYVLEDTKYQPSYVITSENKYLNTVMTEALRNYPVQPATDILRVKDSSCLVHYQMQAVPCERKNYTIPFYAF